MNWHNEIKARTLNPIAKRHWRFETEFQRGEIKVMWLNSILNKKKEIQCNFTILSFQFVLIFYTWSSFGQSCILDPKYMLNTILDWACTSGSNSTQIFWVEHGRARPRWLNPNFGLSSTQIGSSMYTWVELDPTQFWLEFDPDSTKVCQIRPKNVKKSRPKNKIYIICYNNK